MLDRLNDFREQSIAKQQEIAEAIKKSTPGSIDDIISASENPDIFFAQLDSVDELTQLQTEEQQVQRRIDASIALLAAWTNVQQAGEEYMNARKSGAASDVLSSLREKATPHINKLNEIKALIKTQPDVVRVFQEQGFTDIFPIEEQKPETPTAVTPLPDVPLNTGDVEHVTNLVRIREVFIAALQEQRNVTSTDIIQAVFPDRDAKKARHIFYTLFPALRSHFKENGYDIQNIADKGKEGIYKITAIKPEDVTPKKESRYKRWMKPLHESRLQALSYILSADSPTHDGLVSLLGKVTDEKQNRKYNMHRQQAYKAILAARKVLALREQRNLLTPEELAVTRVFHDTYGHDTVAGIDVVAFEQKVRGILGFKDVLSKLTTETKKDNYLDRSVVDNSPFLNRDAVQLAFLLEGNKQVIHYFCSQCELPDNHTLESLRNTFNEHMLGSTTREQIMQARVQGLQHWKAWSQEPNYAQEAGDINEIHVLQVVYSLNSLNDIRLSVDGEQITAMELIARMTVDQKFASYVRSFVKRQQEHVVEPTSDETESTPKGTATRETILATYYSADIQTNFPQVNDPVNDEPTQPQRTDPEIKKIPQIEQRVPEIRVKIREFINDISNYREFDTAVDSLVMSNRYRSLKDTKVTQFIQKKYIRPERRNGIPYFTSRQVVVMRFLASNEYTGGWNKALVKELTQIVDEEIELRSNKK